MIFLRLTKILKEMLVFLFVLALCYGDMGVYGYGIMEGNDGKDEIVTPKMVIDTEIKNVEALFEKLVEKPHEPVLSLDEVEEVHMEIIETIESWPRLFNDSESAAIFLKSQGIYRTISPHINIENRELKSHLLNTLISLFDALPENTKAYLPNNMADKLIEIYETDENPIQKGEALDVLARWLPNNPKIQTRIMKIKGFVPFYKQITKLHARSVNVLMSLLNNLIVEHLAARDDKLPKTVKNLERKRAYEKIGLIEHMSTSTVCHGVANILEMMWQMQKNEQMMMKTVLESLKALKSFCIDYFKDKSNAIDLVDMVHDYVNKDDKKRVIEGLGFNSSEVKDILEDYIRVLKPNKIKSEL